MIKVSQGHYQHLQLQVPNNQGITRPSHSRERQAIMNILNHKAIPNYELSKGGVLDIFAGSGALGIEALSAEATYAVFVENNRQAIQSIKFNIQQLSPEHRRQSRLVQSLNGLLPTDQFMTVFMDPPYALLDKVTSASLVIQPYLLPYAVLVVEHQAGDTAIVDSAYQFLDSRVIGKSQMTLFQFKGL